MKELYNKIKKYKLYALIFIVSILIEIFVCNYTSFRVLFADNKNVEVNFAETYAPIYISEDYTIPSTNSDFEKYNKVLLVEDINFDIYSVKVCASNTTESSSGTITLIASDYPYSKEIVNVNRIISVKGTKFSGGYTYINTSIDSKTTDKLYISLDSYNKELQFNKIILNDFEFDFNFIRVLIIFGFILLTYFIKTKKIYKIMYDKNNKKHSKLYNLICLISILIIFLFCIFEFFVYPEKIVVDEQETSETVILQAKALLNGSLSFIWDADEKLEEIENPYDPSSRYYNDVEYIFDAAYYEGKYYQYFSILPVIFFAIPLKLITGVYFTTRVINCFMMLILLTLVSILYKKLIDKYITKIHMFNLILGYLVVIFGSNLLNYIRGMMYEVPCVFGMISLVSAVLLMLDLKDAKKKIYIRLIFAGIFTAFVVMSKPSFITYYIILFYMLFAYLKNYITNKKELFKRLCAYCIPLGILAIVQMWFNYVRFGSIFDFGAFYQLTVADMNVHQGISLPILIKGILKFLFSIPKIEIFSFPYIGRYDYIFYSMGLNQFEFENCMIGIVFVPIIWCLLMKNKISIKNTNGKKVKFMANLVIITAFLSIIAITCFAGASEPYTIDIKASLTIAAVIVGLKIIEQSIIKEKGSIEKYNYIFLILCLLSLILVMPQSMSSEGMFLDRKFMPINRILEDIFLFWL